MKGLWETMRKFFQVLFELRANLEYKYFDKAVKELRDALEQLIDKIRKINAEF
ncbi:MAG: hypothetical protein J7K59_01435 [Candidatus Korarchaeota archaeon]|nr:hypothetical protein [Candidatus Korarchaeota archaeon]